MPSAPDRTEHECRCREEEEIQKRHAGSKADILARTRQVGFSTIEMVRSDRVHLGRRRGRG